MKFFQKRGVAIVVMLLMIAVAVVWGQYKKPAIEVLAGGAAIDQSLSTGAFTPYIVDGAGVLSAKTEKAVALYDANWDKMTGFILAVVTVDSAADLEDAAYEWADDLRLGENDAILLIAADSRDYTLVASGDFYDVLDAQSASFVDGCMLTSARKGDFDGAVVELVNQLHVAVSKYASGRSEGAGSVLKKFLLVLLFVFVLWIILDRLRYNRYRRRQSSSGMGAPTVYYHPVFWGRSMYRPSSARPRPAAPRHDNIRPSGGYSGGYSGGGTRPASGGSHTRPSSGGGVRPSSGSSTRPSSGSFGGGRGGGFGGSSRSVTRSSGSSRSSGASRSGSFGGSRSSGRGGGFGGGRGGSFGGKR
ncbi:MAG: TPM domain-containing protein [Ruminococcaceae bacterium]|nr:TPM domain-containing protein [Oscillospiraceae bacterium]